MAKVVMGGFLEKTWRDYSIVRFTNLTEFDFYPPLAQSLVGSGDCFRVGTKTCPLYLAVHQRFVKIVTLL
ncbi:MAG: hypothetical protein ACYCY5_04235, partial [Sulfuricella sp.]